MAAGFAGLFVLANTGRWEYAGSRSPTEPPCTEMLSPVAI